MSSAWDFLAWFNVSLAATFFGWWAIGDFTRVYWLPLLKRKDWMMEPRWMQFFWAVAYVLLNISSFLIWEEQGGWELNLGPLTLSIFTTIFACIWHYVLYCNHRIQLSFYVAVLTAVLGLVTTIWFFILDVVPGIFTLIVLIWLFYIAAWSYTLTGMNMKPDGNVSLTGGNPRLVFQTINSGLPRPEDWYAAGRNCPYKKSYGKAARSSGVSPGYSAHPVV